MKILIPINIVLIKLLSRKNLHAQNFLYPSLKTFSDRLLGGFHYQTDGWRQNSDQNDNVANAFMQLEITPATSVQAELRHRDVKRGEVELRFAPNDFRPNLRQRDDTNSGRFGFRHAFSPSSTLLGSFMYQDADRSLRDSPSPVLRLFDLKGNDQAVSGEVQHLFRSKFFSLVSGGGHFNIDSKDDIHTELVVTIPRPFPLPPLRIVSRARQLVDRDVQHTNVYLYSHIDLPKTVTLTLGASGDFFDTDIPGMESRKQFNPKIGVTWNPLADTTLRAAAFRTFKRTLITNQTLEPTQVAGFNQFFDDFNSTRAWRYGGAIDQKFTKTVFGGLEYTYRDMQVPFVSLTPTGPQAREVNWDEKLFRGYLFWTPHEWVALSTGTEWERLVRDKRFVDNAKWVDTNRVPLGINFFHPSGLSASLKASYVNQRGVFQREGSVTFQPGRDQFWVFDAAINYRLPNRYGFITVGATNLFDKQFKYFDTDKGSVNVNPRVIPDRVVFGRLTLALP